MSGNCNNKNTKSNFSTCMIERDKDNNENNLKTRTNKNKNLNRKKRFKKLAGSKKQFVFRIYMILKLENINTLNS